MTRIIISSERSALKATLRSFLRLFDFGTSPTNDNNVAVFRAEAPKLSQALLTVRMALNPGETVATAAPRIRQEAVRFEEFLAKPGSISRITLRMKEFDETGFCKSSEQYAVKDPDENQASIWLRLKTSAHTVLDFVAYDEEDRSMFSILRTYANWTGSRTCDLGNRTFHLNMVEAKEAGYVNVWAGFTPASVVATAGSSCVKPNLQPIAASAAAGAGGGSMGTRLFRTVSPLLVVLAVVSAFLSGKFLTGETKATERQTPIANNSFADAVFLNLTGASSTQLFVTANANNPTTARDTARLVEIEKEKVMRLADIRDFKISVDKKSCDGGENRCLKLLAGFQRNLKSRFERLNLPTVAPEVRPNAQSAKLIVSYHQTDSGRELIHLALCDHNGSLWNAEHGLDHEQDSDIEFVNIYAAQFSTEVLVTVMRAKDQVMTEAALHLS